MTKTILVAEDDTSISEVMKIILESEGYTVSLARNRSDVFKVIRNGSPSLIFLDVRLGGEKGEDIAAELRSGKETAHIPLIIVSADSTTPEIAEQVGADSFLLKPFEMDELIACVKQYSQ